jgi:lipoate synthase
MTVLTMTSRDGATAESASPYAPMVDYIVEATAKWWTHLTGLTPEFCRDRFNTEMARDLIEEIYAHNVDEGASDEAAVSTAGVVLVHTVMPDVSDEQARQLENGLRDYVRNSVREG